jgi:integrase
LLDNIEDGSGPVVADAVLALVRGLCNWYATRNDDYLSPVVKGMRRTDPKARARARVLDDDEIRALWAATADGDVFSAYVRVGLLTAQRREKIVQMRWADITLDGEWRIPSTSREKGTAGSLVLPDMALANIQGLPRFASNPHVFAGSGKGPIAGHSKRKARLDAKLNIAPWTYHDLRRTGRSLMSRAGVLPHVAEKVLGHAVQGVEATYDRHDYKQEKAHALRALASLVESIVNPSDNVTPMRRAL